MQEDDVRRKIRDEGGTLDEINQVLAISAGASSLDLVEEINDNTDFGGDPQDIDTLKELQEEFQKADKIDYEKEKEDAINNLHFTEHQYETFKQFRKDNNAEGVNFSDYVKYHHEYEKIKDNLKRSNIDFNQYYKLKTRPQQIIENYEEGTKQQKLRFESVRLDPIEEEIVNHDKLTAQEVFETIKQAEKQNPQPLQDKEQEFVKLYFQETEIKEDADYELKFSNISSQTKTDKNELKFLCDLVHKTYTDEEEINHKIYYSKITGSPIARIIQTIDEQIILTIRGTNDLKDVYEDLNFKQTKLSEHFKEINEKHDAITTQGFVDFTQDVYNAVYVDLLHLLFETGKTLTIASHSLGCASALILHAIFLSTGQPVDLNVMFGSPRIFYYSSQMFDMFEQENILRVCAEQDGITFLPPLDLLGMFHIGKSLIISADSYEILPYGDYYRDTDFFNELYKLGKSKIRGYAMKQLLLSIVPSGLLSSIFNPVKYQQYLQNAEDIKKIFYEEHKTTTYLNYLDILPDEINFDIPDEIKEEIHVKQLKKNLKAKAQQKFEKRINDEKQKTLPHVGEIKRNNVSPEVLGFYLYKNEEDIKNKLFVFS